MTAHPADYCPDCGAALESVAVEGRERRYCADCDRIVWHNPVPCAGVAVVERRADGPADAVCCVKRAVPPGVGEWTIPGGHVEVGEDPAGAAARELAEETGLAVDPGSLRIFDAVTLPPADDLPGEKHVVSIVYVADRAAVDGEPTAGSDADDVRFWTPAAFDASGERFRPVHEGRFRAIAAGERASPAGRD